VSFERHISVADVAEALSLDSGEVLSLIRSGALAGVDVAVPGATRKRWRIPASALQQFLDARRSLPPTRRTRRRKQAAEPSYY
jgi:hypothetical protein